MGALPKRRTSSYRKGKRRSSHAASTKNYVTCKQCGKPRPTHQACPHCGTYK